MDSACSRQPVQQEHSRLLYLHSCIRGTWRFQDGALAMWNRGTRRLCTRLAKRQGTTVHRDVRDWEHAHPCTCHGRCVHGPGHAVLCMSTELEDDQWKVGGQCRWIRTWCSSANLPVLAGIFWAKGKRLLTVRGRDVCTEPCLDSVSTLQCRHQLLMFQYTFRGLQQNWRPCMYKLPGVLG